MRTAIQYELSKAEEEDVRRFLQAQYPKMPEGLLGGCMEREAYLDQVACDLRQMPEKSVRTRKRNGASR